MAKLPLAGLKILVTRPRAQAARQVADITAVGGVPLVYPLLEISPVEDRVVLDAQMQRLDEVDLAVFVSPNAVKYGLAAMGGVPPSGLKVAAVGAGSAKALREAGVMDVIVPEIRQDSEGLLEKLSEVAGCRVMIFRGDGGRELLGDTLRERGAIVEYVCCYLRSKPDFSADQLRQAAPDAAVLTSSEALTHLYDLLAGPLNIPLFVPHPRIAELAQGQSWPEVHLTQAGDEGVIAALTAWALSRK